MKPAPRIYTEAPLGSGRFELSPEEARYVGGVLRLRPGDALRLFSAPNGEWLYELTEIDKRSGSAVPSAQLRAAVPPLRAPALLFAPIKRTQTEWLVQKATELGVAKLQPVITARTNRDQLRLDRLEAIAREAAEQCERLDLPLIAEPVPLRDALGAVGGFVFCDEAGDQPDEPWGGAQGRAPLGARLFPRTEPAPDAVLVGPEGGFTPDERAALRADSRALAVSLGPRILRAETAAIVALTLWQARFGDLG